jgi:8-oxo-dGTP pyrophosphatase MutT (NUDIX family)
MSAAPPTPHQRLAALEQALAQGALPGDPAKQRMWPSRLPARPPVIDPAEARRAAVLILLYPHAERVCLPLMRRTSVAHDAHSGQISLPGGSREPGETPEQTALREAREELGVQSGELRVIGRLSPHFIPVSGFRVMPVVTVAARAPAYSPDPKEVAEILITSLEELETPSCEQTFPLEIRGTRHEIPCWRINGGSADTARGSEGSASPGDRGRPGGGNVLWGATAMILAELLALVAPTRPR